VPFADREPHFEEELPAFKFGHWAVPIEMELSSSYFKTIFTIYFPSYRSAAGVTNLLATKKTWEDRIGPLSIGAYVLIGTMLLSYIQWYIIAIILRRVVVLIQRRHSLVPN
jgi:hypothetical protein